MPDKLTFKFNKFPIAGGGGVFTTHFPGTINARLKGVAKQPPRAQRKLSRALIPSFNFPSNSLSQESSSFEAAEEALGGKIPKDCCTS